MFIKTKLNYLKFGKKKITGKNNTGKTVIYHRGNGAKRLYRLIDFNKYVWNVYGIVWAFEYDPNRNGLLMLICYANGIICYNLAPSNIQIGSKICSVDSKLFTYKGWSTFACNLITGSFIYNIETYKYCGAKLARSAYTYGRVIGKNQNSIFIKLRSGFIFFLNNYNIITYGIVSSKNLLFINKYKKASYYKYLGWRSHVRGVAMNPIDHTMGGGEGKSSGGKPSQNKQGLLSKGFKTRSKKRKLIFYKK